MVAEVEGSNCDMGSASSPAMESAAAESVTTTPEDVSAIKELLSD